MQKLFKKGWFQVIALGVVIGAVMIIVDNKVSKASSNKPENFAGAIQTSTDEVYFTNAEYNETKYDFGKVKEGDTIVHKFKIRNTGNEPLMIFKAKGSCDCVIAKFSGKPILPNAEEEIGVFFKTIGRKGKQVRTVTISTNTEPSESILMLTGEVE